MKILVIGSPYVGKTYLIEKFVKKKNNYSFADIREYRKIIAKNYFSKNKNSIGPLTFQIKLLILNPILFFLTFFFLVFNPSFPFNPTFVLRIWKYYFIQFYCLEKKLRSDNHIVIQDEGLIKKIYDSIPDEIHDKKKFNWWKKNYKTVNKKLLFSLKKYNKIFFITTSPDNVISRMKKRDGNILGVKKKAAYKKRFLLQQKFYNNLSKICNQNNIQFIKIKNISTKKAYYCFSKAVKLNLS